MFLSVWSGVTAAHAPVVNWLSSLVVNQQYGDRNPVGAPGNFRFWILDFRLRLSGRVSANVVGREALTLRILVRVQALVPTLL